MLNLKQVFRNAALPLVFASTFSTLTARSFAADNISAGQISKANDLYDQADALAPLKREINQKIKPEIVLGVIQCSFGEDSKLCFVNTSNKENPLVIWDPKNKSFRDDLFIVPSDLKIAKEDRDLGSFSFDYKFQLEDGKIDTLRIARHRELAMEVYMPLSESGGQTAGSVATDMFQLGRTGKAGFEKLVGEDKINGVKIINGVSKLPNSMLITLPSFLKHQSYPPDTALVIKTSQSSILVPGKYVAVEIKPVFDLDDSGRNVPDTEIRLYTEQPREGIPPDLKYYLRSGHIMPGYMSTTDSFYDLLKAYEASKKK